MTTQSHLYKEDDALKTPAAALALSVGRTYRAKKPGRIANFPDPLVNDRTIIWMWASDLQYDGPAVRIGGKYPRMSIESFRQWADRDVTDELPPGHYATWPLSKKA